MNNCLSVKNVLNSERTIFAEALSKRFNYDSIRFVLVSLTEAMKNKSIITSLKRDSDLLINEEPLKINNEDVFVLTLFKTDTINAYKFLNRLELLTDVTNHYISDEKESLEDSIRKFCSTY